MWLADRKHQLEDIQEQEGDLQCVATSDMATMYAGYISYTSFKGKRLIGISVSRVSLVSRRVVQLSM